MKKLKTKKQVVEIIPYNKITFSWLTQENNENKETLETTFQEATRTKEYYVSGYEGFITAFRSWANLVLSTNDYLNKYSTSCYPPYACSIVPITEEEYFEHIKDEKELDSYL